MSFNIVLRYFSKYWRLSFQRNNNASYLQKPNISFLSHTSYRSEDEDALQMNGGQYAAVCVRCRWLFRIEVQRSHQIFYSNLFLYSTISLFPSSSLCLNYQAFYFENSTTISFLFLCLCVVSRFCLMKEALMELFQHFISLLLSSESVVVKLLVFVQCVCIGNCSECVFLCLNYCSFYWVILQYDVSMLITFQFWYPNDIWFCTLVSVSLIAYYNLVKEPWGVV